MLLQTMNTKLNYNIAGFASKSDHQNEDIKNQPKQSDVLLNSIQFAFYEYVCNIDTNMQFLTVQISEIRKSSPNHNLIIGWPGRRKMRKPTHSSPPTVLKMICIKPHYNQTKTDHFGIRLILRVANSRNKSNFLKSSISLFAFHHQINQLSKPSSKDTLPCVKGLVSPSKLLDTFISFFSLFAFYFVDIKNSFMDAPQWPKVSEQGFHKVLMSF